MTIRPLYYAVPALLLIPLIFTFTTEAVNWGAGDFLIMGLMLLTAAALIDLAWRRVSAIHWRSALILAIVAGFGLIWAELAVGLF